MSQHNYNPSLLYYNGKYNMVKVVRCLNNTGVN